MPCASQAQSRTPRIGESCSSRLGMKYSAMRVLPANQSLTNRPSTQMDAFKLLSRSSRLKNNSVKDSNKGPLPSAAGRDGTDEAEGGDIVSRKRKREDFEETGPVETLDEAEVRKIQKQHKIKITNLRLLHGIPKSESRKAQKEASRLFPQPLLTFSQLRHWNVNQRLLTNLAQQAYREPTEVQIAAIPLLLEADKAEPDLLTVAPTGSGKTLAFLIPLIHKISTSRSGTTEAQTHASSLIIAPTKELVGQIVNEGKKLALGTGVRIAGSRKGMRLDDADDVRNGNVEHNSSSDEGTDDTDHWSKGTVVKTDIIVSTPLMLLNAISKSNSKHSPLPHIQNLTLDEADYLLDPLFRDQVMSIWSGCTSPALRVSLWSATIGSSIEELALSTISSRSSAHAKRQPPLIRIVIGLKDTSIPTIAHKLVYASTEQGKLMGLRQILHPAPSTTKGQVSTAPVLRPPFLVFTQTISRAMALHEELKYDIPAAAGGSNRIAVLHSNLSSAQRAKTMTGFRQGKIWVLITTDLLSRGIDFRGINAVVNYDIPTTAASYVHRAGRTGRAKREGGICVTFYTREDIKYLKPIANLISVSENKESENRTGSRNNDYGMPSWLLTALPELSKQDRKELKQRGVDVRRAVKESDDKQERRKKGKNRIGTSSGYERRLKDRKQGMVEGSKRRKEKALEKASDGESDAGFEGFGD